MRARVMYEVLLGGSCEWPLPSWIYEPPVSIAPVPLISAKPAKSLVDLLPAVVPQTRDELTGDLWVEIVEQLDGAQGLLNKVADWDDLAAHSTEPNVFHESWQLIPAIQQFAPGRCRFALVYRGSKRQDVAPRLCGLFPFLESGGGWLRPRRWTLWEHDYCYLNSPLVRQGHAVETWKALFDFLEQSKSAPALVDLPCQLGEGELAQALTEVLFDRRALVENVETHTRALTQKSADWTAYAAAAMSTHHRRELRRLWRRLMEQGDLTERVLSRNQGRAVESWIDSFLHLESQGWKGQQGSSVNVASGAEEYFRSIVRSAYARNRLQMFGLFLNGEPIAMKVNFLASPGAFAFKIAYDERFAKYSPGVQLELDNLLRMQDSPEVDWMDSCAVPKHSMINRLWKERRTIQHLRVSTGRLMGNLEIGVRTLLRSIRRSLNKKGVAVVPEPDNKPESTSP